MIQGRQVLRGLKTGGEVEFDSWFRKVKMSLASMVCEERGVKTVSTNNEILAIVLEKTDDKLVIGLVETARSVALIHIFTLYQHVNIGSQVLIS